MRSGETEAGVKLEVHSTLAFGQGGVDGGNYSDTGVDEKCLDCAEEKKELF